MKIFCQKGSNKLQSEWDRIYSNYPDYAIDMSDEAEEKFQSKKECEIVIHRSIPEKPARFDIIYIIRWLTITPKRYAINVILHARTRKKL